MALLQLPNGQLAAGSANDIKIWDPLNNRTTPLRTLELHNTNVIDLDLSPNKLLLASVAEGALLAIWNYTLSSTYLLSIYTGTVPARAVCFISNQIVASGSDDKSIKLWYINTTTATSESYDSRLKNFEKTHQK